MAIENMDGQPAGVGDMLGLLSRQLSGNAEQLSEIGAQVNRVARIQYKTGQETLEKLEHLHAGLDDVRQRQAGHEADTARLQALEQQNSVMAGMIMRWLDDIDLIRARLQGGEQETWRQLLERWAGQLLQALTELGICELDILGASFDPQWAESIGTIDRDPAWEQEGGSSRWPAPYAVVEVVRRGFAARNGQLLRKAQVITIREKALAEQHNMNNGSENSSGQSNDSESGSSGNNSNENNGGINNSSGNADSSSGSARSSNEDTDTSESNSNSYNNSSDNDGSENDSGGRIGDGGRLSLEAEGGSIS